MKLYLIVGIVLLGVVSSFPKPHPGKLVASKAPEFSIDLNVPPKHRWDQIIPKFQPLLQKFIDMVYAPYDISDATWNKIGLFMNSFYKYKEVLEEIKGIAKVANVKWEKVLVANFMYEFSTFTACSSILVKDAMGNIMHGRNLDFPYQEYISKMTAIVHVYRGSHYIGQWDQIIGGVIVLSGESINGVSITEDSRFTNDILEVMDALFVKQYVPSALLTRYVLEEEMQYEQATQTMLHTNTSSPIYYIIGGKTDGMVIEKQIEGYHAYYTVDDTQWFYVQTNYDWGQDPYYDDRKTEAAKRIEAIGRQNINKDNFYNILTEFPTLVDESIYSLMFSVKYQYNEINLWYGNYQDPINEQVSKNEESIYHIDENLKKFFELVEEGYFERITEEYFQKNEDVVSA